MGELAFSLKKTIEDHYGRVRVRGELSRVSVAASGHMYSSLKDDNAVIDAICWKGTMGKLSIRPEEGLEVICTGRLTTYPARSNYQLIIESMELAGEGALLKMLEDRRKKLAAEGLFDESRKRPLPFLPRVIGVVTSPTGAVIRDILHRVTDRFPRHVILWPAVVQGQNAAETIAAAINGFQTIESHGLPKPDVLIVGRGGGSLEDLMPFNEEIVVRAVAQSGIPVISAVGHETDTTLCDYAADVRAPTPTGAAEMAVPVRANLVAQVLDDEKRLVHAMSRQIETQRTALQNTGARLGEPRRLLDLRTQKLDALTHRLSGIFTNFLHTKTSHLSKVLNQLQPPKSQIQTGCQALSRWSEQLVSALPKTLEHRQRSLDHAVKMLEAYSFENVLNRGFVVVQNDQGDLITDPAQTKPGQAVSLRFKNQKRAQAVMAHKASKPTKPQTSKEDAHQADLF